MKKSFIRPKISLRALLFVAVAIAVACAWIGSKRYQSQQQTHAVAELMNFPQERFGFRSDEHHVVVYDSGPFGIRTPRARWLPRWLRSFIGEESFHRVERVDLSGTQICNSDLVLLKNLSDVKSLNLESTAIGDGVGNYLDHLDRMEHLCLGETNITGEGLKDLQKMSHLCELELWRTELNDESLDGLSVMTQLKRINLCQTKVTSLGVAKLERAMPNCRIWWDGTEAFQLITVCPDSYLSDDPNPSDIIRAVNHLMSLGRDGAIDALREYTRIPPPRSRAWDHSYDHSRLCQILPLLFEPVEPEQRLSSSSSSRHDRRTAIDEWPSNFVYLEGDIPFHCNITDRRIRDSSLSYLVNWCAQYCVLRSRPLRPDDNPQAAANRLIARLMKEGDAYNSGHRALREHIRDQAKRMTEHLGVRQSRWSDLRQDYVVAN